MTEWHLRERTLAYETPWRKPVSTPSDAVRFIDHVCFCVLFPVKSVPLPSLYYALSKKVDAKWDKHAQLIWKWKDDLPKKRRAFYGKYFRSRGTFLSLESLSLLLAAHDTAVDPDDAEDFYSAGRIS